MLSRSLPADQRPIAQRILESLITSDGRRILRTHAELAAEVSAGFPRPLAPETLDALLTQLADSRLLRTQEQEQQTAEPQYELAPGVTHDMTQALAYELAHDYLLDKIKLDRPRRRARQRKNCSRKRCAPSSGTARC